MKADKMYSIDSFGNWLKVNTALTDSSVYKYSRAVKYNIK